MPTGRGWRSICPDITLRSTFIVGFPGETDQDFDQLLDFLEQAQLDRVGCFQYSAVDGAVANALPDPVPESLKQERWDRFMQVQQRISRERLQEKVGQQIDVLVDGFDEHGAIGRSKADAPEIDGNVFFDAADGLAAGDIVKVSITGADDYDLFGELSAAP